MARHGVLLVGTILAGCNAIFGVDELRSGDPLAEGGAANVTAASSSSAPAVGTGGVGGFGGGYPDACALCGDAMPGCQAERDACMANAECGALSMCLDGCSDSFCRSDCLTTHHAGIAALYARYDCERCSGVCTTLCILECQGCGGTDCNRCAGSTCAQQICSEVWNACLASSDCFSHAMCVGACSDDPACEDQCANDNPVGAALYADLMKCVGCSWEVCYDVCNGDFKCST